MGIKPFEHYVANADSDSLASKLVENHPEAAEALASALVAHLQDKDIRENYDELDMEQALN